MEWAAWAVWTCKSGGGGPRRPAHAGQCLKERASARSFFCALLPIVDLIVLNVLEEKFLTNVRDGNGMELKDGDPVALIEDLQVKGLVLKTCFLKKG